jgi:hypothetical protein
MVRFPLGARVLATCLLASPAAAGTLSVVDTSPSRYQLGVSTTPIEIRVTFDDVPVLTEPAQMRVAGVMSGLHTGSVYVDGASLVFEPTEPFIPGELVSVNLRSDLSGTLGGTLDGGHFFAFTTASGSVVPEFSTRAAFGASQRPYFIHGGDLDGDGTPDVAAPNEDDNSVSIFLNTKGTGELSSRTEYGVGFTPSSIFGEDFDNDGDQDLATADIQSSTMSILRNVGDGTFTPEPSYPAGSVTRQVHGGDFDGDNDIDICTTSNGNGRVFLFRNQGDGTYSPLQLLGIGDAPFAIRTGDVNGDGHLDIAVANRIGDDLTILMNDGAGNFTVSGHYPIGDGPWCLNGNDMDGDGDFDLVSVASSANRLVVLINDGTGAFTANPYPTDVFPLGVFAADLDGDGDIDATASNFAGASVDVFLNDGNGVMSPLDRLHLPAAGTYTWAHDLDGDGDLDLSTLDEIADSLFVYYNGDTAVPVGGPGGASPPAASVERPRLDVWPNPMGSGAAATLRLVLPTDAGGARVDIVTPDGRRVRSFEDVVPAGGAVELEWDGRDDADRAVASGLYMVVVTAGEARVARAVQIIR